MMIIYELFYNPTICESASQTLSLHRTLAGAYKALKKHKIKRYNEEREADLTIGKKSSVFRSGRCYLLFESWEIKKIELMD